MREGLLSFEEGVFKIHKKIFEYNIILSNIEQIINCWKGLCYSFS